jgi:hypothetical protein
MAGSMKTRLYLANRTITSKGDRGVNRQDNTLGDLLGIGSGSGGKKLYSKSVSSLDAMYILAEGQAKLLDRNGLTLRTLGPGACLLGGHSMLMTTSEFRTNNQEGDIISVGKCRVLVLTNGDLNDAFRTHPQSEEQVRRNATTIAVGRIDDLILQAMDQNHAPEEMRNPLLTAQLEMNEAAAKAGGGVMSNAGIGAGGGAATEVAVAGGAPKVVADGTSTLRNAGLLTEQDKQMAVKEMREKLQWMPMFRQAPADFLDRLLTMMRIEQVAHNTTVLKEGSRGGKMFVVHHGTADIISEVDDSRKVGSIKAGDFAGDMAILLREPQSTTVIATSPLTIFSVQAQDFQLLITRCAPEPS